MSSVRLSILISMYNEANSIKAVLDRVVTAPASFFQAKQVVPNLIVVDNGSGDKSSEVVEEFARTHPEVSLRLIRYPKNIGKGAAIRHAIAQAQSDFCIIQDADLEYDPIDYPKLLKPLLAGEADVVLGSRLLNDVERRPLGFWQAVANRIISTVTGMAAGLALSDVETGFKAFRTSLAQSVPLRSDRFGLDPELIVRFAKRRARFVEVPITYRGRTFEQGKKIRPWDTLDAFASIFRAWFFGATHSDERTDTLVAMSGAKRFNRWMADTIAPWVKGDVLEVGAGIGNLTVLLASGEHRYVATDHDREHLLDLRSRIEYRTGIELAHCDFSLPEDVARFQQSADTVVCLNVLEHIEGDRLTLANIRHCLRPGGAAIILVPQGPEIFGSLDEALQHKRRYIREELAEKMAAAGFRVAQISGFNHATRPGWYLHSRLLKRRTLSRLQLRLFDLLVPLWKRIDHKLPWPATSLIAIGLVD